MLDFFVILTKGGVRLWCFPNSVDIFRVSINTFLKSLILKENAGLSPFVHDSRAIRMYMDNEFNLLFIAAYQSVLQLNYVDKFLTAIAREFRDRYKNELGSHDVMCRFDDFSPVYTEVLKRVEAEDLAMKKGRTMRTFTESEKSKKTVASMIVSRNKKPLEKPGKDKKSSAKTDSCPNPSPHPSPGGVVTSKDTTEDAFEEKRRKFAEKVKASKKSKDAPSGQGYEA
ncbi:unnamed protein product [Calicophoron daubneyi]|uniref:Signal recognition particle receptor alpha subunit N-terminal domain-containing protein n=1 Tax=Calicophoron daubneyi TaxID=300641 RepID=A0AAV2TLS6_CALDB